MRWMRIVCSIALTWGLIGCISVRVEDVALTRDAFALHETGFISFTTIVDSEEQPAVVYVPAAYEPARGWPLIVFLHGMGERGDDGLRQMEVGIGKAIRTHPERFPCLVVMPQCSRSTVWSAQSNSRGASAWDHIDAAIEYVRDNYTVDDDQISLTGLSMGGYGTFSYGAANAGRFSALMPICGGGSPDAAAALAKSPMWVFHGGADPIVNPERSRQMVEAVRAAGGDVQYTEYPGVGHNSWDKAYGTQEAIEWLLARRR